MKFFVSFVCIVLRENAVRSSAQSSVDQRVLRVHSERLRGQRQHHTA
jgi:hypothetical protein